MKRLVIYELEKILLRPLTRACFAVVLLFCIFLSFSSFHNKYATDGKGKEGTGKRVVEIDQEVSARYAGVLTDDKVRQMVDELIPKGDFRGLSAKYVYQNALQSAVAARFVDAEGNWNGLGVSDVFGEEEIQIGYVDGWLSTSQDLVKVLVVLTLAVIVMTAVVVVTDISIALILYGREGLSCSILFSQLTYAEQYIPFNITGKTLLSYQALLAFTGAGSAVGMTLWLSSVCKSQMGAAVLSLAVYLFPLMLPVTETSPLYKLIILLPIYHTQFISLMSADQIGGQILYSVWAVPAAVLLITAGSVLGRNAFAHHQVA